MVGYDAILNQSEHVHLHNNLSNHRTSNKHVIRSLSIYEGLCTAGLDSKVEKK